MRYSGISGASALDALEQEFVRAKDIIAQAKCKVARAGAARMRSMNDAARTDFHKALELVRGRGEAELEADCLSGLAAIARMQDERTAARALYEQARALYKRAGVLTGEASCLWGLAEIARMQDEHTAARALYEQARELYKRAGALTGEARCFLLGPGRDRADAGRAHGGARAL